MDRRSFLTTSAAAAGALALPASLASAGSLADQTRIEAFKRLFFLQCKVNNRWIPIASNKHLGILVPPLQALMGGFSYSRDTNVLEAQFFSVSVSIGNYDLYDQFDVLELEDIFSRLRSDCRMEIKTTYIKHGQLQ